MQEFSFILDLALIFLSTKILGLLTKKFRMPQVVGALLAYIAAKKNNQQILLKICYDKL